jgi:hypothetical protein
LLWQEPKEQLSLTEHDLQSAPPLPQAADWEPSWQTPLESQQPVHVDAHGGFVGQPRMKRLKAANTGKIKARMVLLSRP